MRCGGTGSPGDCQCADCNPAHPDNHPRPDPGPDVTPEMAERILGRIHTGKSKMLLDLVAIVYEDVGCKATKYGEGFCRCGDETAHQAWKAIGRLLKGRI